MHPRFKRKVWVFPHDFTGALAKWLVHQSPYTVPDKLEICISEFDYAIREKFEFDKNNMCKVDLSDLTGKLDKMLWAIPAIAALNQRKNGNQSPFGFSSRFGGPIDPDDDFIDITAVAQNITCELADREDAEELFEMRRVSPFRSFLLWAKMQHKYGGLFRWV